VVGKVFGPKRDEVTGAWRRLHNEGLYDLYFTKFYSADRMRKVEIGRAYGAYGGED
jgi:hypothetical protein